MDQRVWRVKVQGGYMRIVEIADGKEQPDPISVNSKFFGEQIATALNRAYAAGVADAVPDVKRTTKKKVVSLLNEHGYADAADLVRQHPM